MGLIFLPAYLVTRPPVSVSFVSTLLLAGAFVLSHYCRKFTLHIEQRWRALSAGVAVAYVFVSVMPELDEHRPAVAESTLGSMFGTETRIYVWALSGFVAFAGLTSRLFAFLAGGVLITAAHAEVRAEE